MTPGQQVSSSGSLPPSLATWGGGACLPVNTSNSTGHWRISLEMCWWAGRQRGFLLLSYLLGAQPCHFDLPETRTDCLRWGSGGGSLTWSGSMGKCQFMGQFTSRDNPESDHQDIGTAPSDFLSHFVTWKKIVYLHIYLRSAQGHTY